MWRYRITGCINSNIMYKDIVIPTYELALLMVTCGLVGYYIGKFIAEWKRLK